jgi:hypothetical protein
MRCAFSGWEGQRSTPDGKTHGHKLAHARREGPVEHRDIEIILLSWDQDFGDIRLDWTRKNSDYAGRLRDGMDPPRFSCASAALVSQNSLGAVQFLRIGVEGFYAPL